MYRKRNHYKEAMRDYFKEEAKQEVKKMLVEIMANPDSKIRQQLASVMSSQEVQTMQLP
jgi:predicted component of type VI protein secretion system